VKVLVSGIGRSGTTMMYQQIGMMMREAFRAPRYRYEPYLWNLNIRNTNEASWSQQDLHISGMHVHQKTPLFQEGAGLPLHDDFVADLFGSRAALPGDPESPDSWLVKIIRGSGRLGAYLEAVPELKLVICLRNPVDTLNSSLGMFSFTGEEFHPSDKDRLLAEAGALRGARVAEWPGKLSHLALSALWWRVFTDWSLRVAEQYPDRCHLFVHEMMGVSPDAEIDALVRFLGFSSSETFKVNLKENAGQKISTTHLLAADLAELLPDLDHYLATVLADCMSPEQRLAFSERLLTKYAAQEFTPQLAADRLGRKLPIQLRGDILNGHGAGLKYTPAPAETRTRVPLRVHLSKRAPGGEVALGAFKKLALPPPARRRAMTFGCCITSFNNRETIRDAIFSALDQTMPFDRIVVVDDGSTDGSRVMLQDLENRYSSLYIHYRQTNGGVSAARDQGIRLLATDYVTQLDGDDCFWPVKAREEAEILFDDPEAVAFSRFHMDDGKQLVVTVDCSAHAGDGASVFRSLLARKPGIPRDLTMRRDAYLKAGGYDYRLTLYEDWDLKLRLAQMGMHWRQSEAQFGTIYNVRRAGLSAARQDAHVNARTHVFLNNCLAVDPIDDLADTYMQAVENARTPVALTVEALLRQGAEDHSVRDLLSWLTTRQGRNELADAATFEQMLARRTSQGHVSLSWSPALGFVSGKQVLPTSGGAQLHWQYASEGTIDLHVIRDIRGLQIDTFNPIGESNVEIDIRSSSGSAYSAQYRLPLSRRAGANFLPDRLVAEARLKPGRYCIVLMPSTRWTPPAALKAQHERDLYLLIGSIRPLEG